MEADEHRNECHACVGGGATNLMFSINRKSAATDRQMP
jgi:hypothetical protein